MKYDSIIFDLDGTLWDSTHSCVEAWNQCYEKFKVSDRITHQQMSSTMGMDAKTLKQHLFATWPEEKADAFLEASLKEVVRTLRLRPGVLYPYVEDGLAALASMFPLYIVSNCQKGYIEVFLEQTGLGELFQDFESFGNTGQPKFQNIQRVINRNDLNLPIYIGDTMGDYMAASKINLPFAHVTYGFGYVEPNVPKFTNFDHLVDYLVENRFV
ncbi:MAG: HAD family hydrolase [Bdellovibrionota bacterium]